jgi:hypothetical protein
MASKVNRRSLCAEDFFSSSWGCIPSEPLDHGRWVCAAFFFTGLQPDGCTKQLNKVYAGRPFAWIGRRQAARLAPEKIMRSPRRLFKTSRSRCKQRAPFGAGSTRGQPQAISSGSDTIKKKPSRAGVRSKRRGREPRCKGGRRDQRPHRCATPTHSSLACLRSAVWLPGTVGMARLGCLHRCCPRGG